MSLKTDLVKKLTEYGENPRNEFDKIIHNNIEKLPELSEKRLSELYALRRKGERLCRIVPYSRKDIDELIGNEEVSVHNCVAELEDCFNIADYIFSKSE